MIAFVLVSGDFFHIGIYAFDGTPRKTIFLELVVDLSGYRVDGVDILGDGEEGDGEEGCGVILYNLL